jgi:hypothetical protein
VSTVKDLPTVSPAGVPSSGSNTMSGHIAGPPARSIVNPVTLSPPVEVFVSVKVPAV